MTESQPESAGVSRSQEVKGESHCHRALLSETVGPASATSASELKQPPLEMMMTSGVDIAIAGVDSVDKRDSGGFEPSHRVGCSIGFG